MKFFVIFIFPIFEIGEFLKEFKVKKKIIHLFEIS